MLRLSVQQIVDTGHRIQKSADGLIVIQCIDDVRNVLAHIYLMIPLTGQKLRRAVHQVGGEHFIDDALLKRFIEDLQAVAEQTESDEEEDAAGALLFQLHGYIQDGFTGGDHIVYDDHILALDASAQVFMCLDGVLTVDDYGVVAALIEHADIHAHNGGIVHAAGHGTLIGGDDGDLIV